MLGDSLIFVAGMPRSGSMWTFNVVRRLITLAGMTPWPEKTSPNQRAVIKAALSGNLESGSVCCIKTHCAIPLDRPGVKVLCNIRDIRDATLSFMRFMKCPFDDALESARESMQITDHYLGTASLSVMPIDYDDILDAATDTVEMIARFIDADVSKSKVDEIVADLSPGRIADKLNALGNVAINPDGCIQDIKSSERYASVRNVDGSFRVYDYETGFQSNHITSCRRGEWREVFSDEQQRMLNILLGDWLQRYGFDI